MAVLVFDAHTDILYDVYQSSLKNDLNRFNNYHLKQLKGIIKGGIWTLYSPDDFDLIKALKVSKDLVDLNNFEVILGIEGLRNLKSVSDLKTIYDLGYRHMMLTWNEANLYATGIKGDKDRGLTKKGYQVLDFMIEHDMIIDLSHLNEKSFYDVLNYTNKNILVSHSNLKKFHDHVRNLSEKQLLKLKSANGLLGLTAVGGFISSEKEEKTLDNFILHVNEAVRVLGIDNVCFGFDFMDYFNIKNNPNLKDLKDATEINNLVKKLFHEGYSKKDIEKLTYYNIYNRFKKHII